MLHLFNDIKISFPRAYQIDENVHRAKGKHPHAIHTDIMHTSVRVNRCCLQYSQILLSQSILNFIAGILIVQRIGNFQALWGQVRINA